MNRSDILNFFTKTKLLQLLENLNHKNARKSWSKDKLIGCFEGFSVEEIIRQCSEKQCQDILEFFDSPSSCSKEECVAQILGLIGKKVKKYTREDFFPKLPKHCGHYNTTDAKFCSTCGKAIPGRTFEYYKNWFYQWLWGCAQDAYYDKMVMLDELCLTFGPARELEYFEATAGQFVEYDDEGGVYTFVAYEYASNLESKRSTDEEYVYNSLRYFGECDYSGPSPVELQALLYLTIPRDEQFTPYFTCTVDSELLKKHCDTVFPSQEECLLAIMSAFSLQDASL